MKEMELYNFSKGPLDQYLDDLIGNTREAIQEKAIRDHVPIIKGVSSISQAFKKTGRGFFYIKDGQSFRSFLYLKNSRVESFGLPKRHYFDCEKVNEGYPYVLSNRNEVTITCSETQKRHENVVLGLCEYCAAIFRELTTQALLNTSFEEFILAMEESDKTQTTETGVDGYVINWTEISTAYRKTKDFTCEKCGIRIDNPDHYHLMQVHHKDHNKRNNSRSNLQCLCIECHSQVDDLHKRNFSEPYQQREIDKFKVIYRKP